MWYAVYEITTGNLYSIGTKEPVGLPSSLGYKAIGNDRPQGVWNPATLEYDPSPAPLEPFSRLNFLLLFTVQERVAIRNGALSDTVLHDFIELIKIADEIDMLDPMTVAGVNMIRNKGIINQTRVDQILVGVRP